MILCHFPHCLLFLVFFMKVGYCCVYMQLFLQISVLAGCEQNSRPSEKAWVFICVSVTVCVRVCVCVPLCVFVWGWGGVGACMNVCSCLYCFKYRKILVCSKCYKYFTEKRVASYWSCFWRLGDICGRKKSELLLERIEWNHYNIMYRLCNQLH